MVDDGGMRTWSHGITIGMGLGLALAGACKDDGRHGPVDQGDAPGQIAARFCAAWFGCDCDGFAERFDSMADCETEIAEQVQDDIDDGNGAGLTYHSDCPGIWIDAIDTLSCQTFFEAALDQDSLDAGRNLAECKLYYGDEGAGQPCDEMPGVPGDDCEVDLVCNGGTCAVRTDPGTQGEDCSQQDPCADGHFCLDLDGDGAELCERLPQLGETCLGTLDLCDLEFYCDQTDKTCVALPTVGEPCGPMGTLRCGEGSVCGAGDMCEAAPGAGEPCVLVCDTGLTCDAGVCAVAPPLVCGGFASND